MEQSQFQADFERPRGPCGAPEGTSAQGDTTYDKPGVKLQQAESGMTCSDTRARIELEALAHGQALLSQHASSASRAPGLNRAAAARSISLIIMILGFLVLKVHHYGWAFAVAQSLPCVLLIALSSASLVALSHPSWQHAVPWLAFCETLLVSGGIMMRAMSNVVLVDKPMLACFTKRLDLVMYALLSSSRPITPATMLLFVCNGVCVAWLSMRLGNSLLHALSRIVSTVMVASLSSMLFAPRIPMAGPTAAAPTLDAWNPGVPAPMPEQVQPCSSPTAELAADQTPPSKYQPAVIKPVASYLHRPQTRMLARPAHPGSSNTADDEFAVLDDLAQLMYSSSTDSDGSGDDNNEACREPPWMDLHQPGWEAGWDRHLTDTQLLEVLKQHVASVCNTPPPVQHVHATLRWPDMDSLAGLAPQLPRRIMDHLNIAWEDQGWQVLSVGMRKGSLIVDVHAVRLASPPDDQTACDQGSTVCSQSSSTSDSCKPALGGNSYAAYRAGMLARQAKLTACVNIAFAAVFVARGMHGDLLFAGVYALPYLYPLLSAIGEHSVIRFRLVVKLWHLVHLLVTGLALLPMPSLLVDAVYPWFMDVGGEWCLFLVIEPITPQQLVLVAPLSLCAYLALNFSIGVPVPVARAVINVAGQMVATFAADQQLRKKHRKQIQWEADLIVRETSAAAACVRLLPSKATQPGPSLGNTVSLEDTEPSPAARQAGSNDAICLLGIPNVATTLQQLLAAMPSAAWVELLEVPTGCPPHVALEVDGHTSLACWDEAGACWQLVPLPSADLPQWASLSPAALLAATAEGTGLAPVKLEGVVANRQVASSSGQTASSGLGVRAVCQQRPVAVIISTQPAIVPTAAPAQEQEFAGAGLVPGDDTFLAAPSSAAADPSSSSLPVTPGHDAPYLTGLRTLGLLASLDGLQLPALIRLEIWAKLPSSTTFPASLQHAQAITHALPVLVLPPGFEQLAVELSAAVDDDMGAQSNWQHMPLEPRQLVGRMGMFLEFSACIAALIEAEVEARAKLTTSGIGSAVVKPPVAEQIAQAHGLAAKWKAMREEGCWLASRCLLAGLVETSHYLVEALCGPEFQVPYQTLSRDTGLESFTLLHLAVLSGRASVVAMTLHQGTRHGCSWSWSVRDGAGLTPLHLLAFPAPFQLGCNGPATSSLASAILQRFPCARKAWRRTQEGLKCTPAQLYAAHGQPDPLPLLANVRSSRRRALAVGDGHPAAILCLSRSHISLNPPEPHMVEQVGAGPESRRGLSRMAQRKLANSVSAHRSPQLSVETGGQLSALSAV